MLHDISQRKRTEERLRQAQKLESIGLLAGGIAHDFNNLLTGILGNAMMAKELAPAGDRIFGMLDEIVSAGDRAAHLVRQMLAYSGKGRFFLRSVDISQVARDMTRLVEASLSKNVRVHLDLARDLPLIKAAPGQMQQMVTNLVLNAAEAIGERKWRAERAHRPGDNHRAGSNRRVEPRSGSVRRLGMLAGAG